MPIGRPKGYAKTGGREKGALNKKTLLIREIADRAVAKGITPLEVMLDNMRFYYSEADKLCAKILAMKDSTEETVLALKELCSFRKSAQECAVDAANYVHPKLTSVTVGGDPDNPLEMVHKIERVLVGSISNVVTIDAQPFYQNSPDTDAADISATH